MSTSFIQPESSNKTVPVSDNQLADDIKTESTDHQSTDSQFESSRDNIDVASPISNGKTSVTEGEQFSGAMRFLSSHNNDQKDLEKLYKLFKRGGRM